MQCSQTSCDGGLECCVNLSIDPFFYCKVASQCQPEPLWQVIVIPSLIFLFIVIIAITIYCKVKENKHIRQKRSVFGYAFQEIRVKPRPFEQKLREFTKINHLNQQNQQNRQPKDKLITKQTLPTPKQKKEQNNQYSPSSSDQ